MRLERIKIEGYRSLKSVEWKPAPLNVLIGANASGKSNFLEALKLLPSAAAGRLKDTIFDSGGMAPLLWNGESKALTVDLEVESRDGTSGYGFSLERLAGTGAYRIGHDRLCFQTPDGLQRVREAAGESVEVLIASRFDPAEEAPELALRSYLASWSVHDSFRHDRTARARESAVTSYEKQLHSDGSNLISVLHTLYEQDDDFRDRIDRAMAAAFPGDYEELSFQSVPEKGRITLAVRWRHTRRHPDASELSDGTLRYLMLLATLANPEPSALIAIDEPETGLHPGMLPIVAELAAEAATTTQVLFTTHSAEFLDAFPEDSLPATTVFEWKGDQTEIKTLSPERLRYWVKDYSLGRFAFSGEAEAAT